MKKSDLVGKTLSTQTVLQEGNWRVLHEKYHMEKVNVFYIQHFCDPVQGWKTGTTSYYHRGVATKCSNCGEVVPKKILATRALCYL